jgi:hypothetical protein
LCWGPSELVRGYLFLNLLVLWMLDARTPGCWLTAYREAWPTQKEWSCHEVMLAGWGMPIGELFDLEALGKHCKKTGGYEFFVVSEPVNVPGGVASPPNILAIF